MNLEIKHLWSHKCPKKWDQYTLIALVITIIVLLILAGITISLTIGQDGLFKIARQAKDNTLEAQELENAILADFEEKILSSTSRDSESIGFNGKVKQNITITNMTGATFKINVTSTDTNNAKKLYYYVDNKLVYEGNDSSYIVTGLEDKSEHSVIVLADKNDMKVITGEGDNISAWLACIGNTENLTLQQIGENQQLLDDLMASESAVEYLCKSKEIILPYAFTQETFFTKIANNEEVMKAICEDEALRLGLYNNYQITESILANSTVAINVMKNSSRYVSTSYSNTTVNVKAFIIRSRIDAYNHPETIGSFLNGTTNKQYPSLGNANSYNQVKKFVSKIYLTCDCAATHYIEYFKI